MVSIENGERIFLAEPDKNDGARTSIVLEKPLAYGSDLGQKCGIHRVLSHVHTFQYLGHRKAAAAKLSPLRPGENPNLPDVGFPEFYLKPLCIRRDFLPQRKVAEEEQGATFCIFIGVCKIGIDDNVVH